MYSPYGMYADDTSITSRDTDFMVLDNRINAIVTSLNEWVTAYPFSLNTINRE